MLMGWDGVDSIGLFHWDGNVNDTPTYSYTIFDSLHKDSYQMRPGSCDGTRFLVRSNPEPQRW